MLSGRDGDGGAERETRVIEVMAIRAGLRASGRRKENQAGPCNKHPHMFSVLGFNRADAQST